MRSNVCFKTPLQQYQLRLDLANLLWYILDNCSPKSFCRGGSPRHCYINTLVSRWAVVSWSSLCWIAGNLPVGQWFAGQWFATHYSAHIHSILEFYTSPLCLTSIHIVRGCTALFCISACFDGVSMTTNQAHPTMSLHFPSYSVLGFIFTISRLISKFLGFRAGAVSSFLSTSPSYNCA